MSGLQALGPLLMGTRRWGEPSDEDHVNKRHKPEKGGPPPAQQDQIQSLVGLVKMLTGVVLAHDKHIQTMCRQDSYVLFLQLDKQGAVPVLQELTTEWKSKRTTPPPTEDQLTLRTHLMGGLLTELHRRVTCLSQSSPGQTLWYTAISKGHIQMDGSWVFQRWAADSQSMVSSNKTPMPMSRMLKTLQTLIDLMKANDHVMRFHS